MNVARTLVEPCRDPGRKDDVSVTTTAKARSVRSVPRVLQVVVTLMPGGTEYLVVEICKRLSQEFGMAVCCMEQEGLWAPALQAEGIEVVALGRRHGFRPEIGRRIAQTAAQRGATLLHCHQYSPFVYGRIAKYWNPALKLIYTEHGRLSDAPPPWKRRLVNPILARFDGPIVAVSDELRSYMLASRFPDRRVSVVHNGIAAGTLPSPAERRNARRTLRVDDDEFVAMTVARLDPVKDLGTLLEAFAIVRRDIPGARLFMVGDGLERETLAARIARDDLAGCVTLTGYRSDVRALLPAADLYVNSSISEGISITILEAMASGLPVVATAVGGTPEVVDRTTGVLVPIRHPDRLAAAILALANDRARRGAYGEAGRRRVVAAFTIERMVGDYARMYRRLLE